MESDLKYCGVCETNQEASNFKDAKNNDVKTCFNCRKAKSIRQKRMLDKISDCCVCKTSGGRIMKGKLSYNNKLYCSSHKNNGIRDQLISQNNKVCEGFRRVCITIVENSIYCYECDEKKIKRNS